MALALLAWVPSNNPMISHKARKRMGMEVEELCNPSKPTKDSRLLKMLDNQGTEEVETSVARAIFVCGIPFNVVWSPYWQDILIAINTAPQGSKGPNYEKFK